MQATDKMVHMALPPDSTCAIRAGEELDAGALRDWLDSHLPGLQGTLEIRQFPAGFSNLTYLLTLGSQRWVLRRPPFGTNVKSAHDMGREFRVLSALHKAYPYAPEPLLFCEDESVLGCKFYLMRYLEGSIVRAQYPPETRPSPALVRGQFLRWFDGLCELHKVDYQKIGLSELGRPAGYVCRQVEGWCKRYTAALTPDGMPGFERTMQWLKDKMPAESPNVAIIHNDYKLDNVVWSRDDPLRLIGVLDWEMATLGDPLMDLGCTLGYWVQPDDPEQHRNFPSMPTLSEGAPTRAELVARFEAQSGLAVDNIDFYFCFGLFRLAGIGQQIYYRFYHGHTKDPRFARLRDKVASLHLMCEKVMTESEL